MVTFFGPETPSPLAGEGQGEEDQNGNAHAFATHLIEGGYDI
jgi:hypothetical protein